MEIPLTKRELEYLTTFLMEWLIENPDEELQGIYVQVNKVNKALTK